MWTVTVFKNSSCQGLQDGNPPIPTFGCKVFQKDEKASARIVIEERHAQLITSRAFWPSPVYCRSWNFDKYKDDSKLRQQHDGENVESKDAGDNGNEQ